MHDTIVTNCNSCEHFTSSFYTDKDTEWGYCTEMLGDHVPSRKETDAIKAEVDSGNLDRLNELSAQGVLFEPKEIDCGSYVDIFPE
jgi:hypothetical protein